MIPKFVVREDSSYPIQPKHIDTSRSFSGVFEDTKTEEAARLVVQYCQHRGGWVSFLPLELFEYVTERIGTKSFFFGNLWRRDNPEDDYLVADKDGRLKVTHEFIMKCFSVAPASMVQETRKTQPMVVFLPIMFHKIGRG